MANTEETVVGIPVIVVPIEVQVPLGIVPIEVRNVAVAIDLVNGTLCKKPSMPLPADSFAQAVSNP